MNPALRIEGNEAFRLKFQQGVAHGVIAVLRVSASLLRLMVSPGRWPPLEDREDPARKQPSSKGRSLYSV